MSWRVRRVAIHDGVFIDRLGFAAHLSCRRPHCPYNRQSRRLKLALGAALFPSSSQRQSSRALPTRGSWVGPPVVA